MEQLFVEHIVFEASNLVWGLWCRFRRQFVRSTPACEIKLTTSSGYWYDSPLSSYSARIVGSEAAVGRAAYRFCAFAAAVGGKLQGTKYSETGEQKENAEQ